MSFIEKINIKNYRAIENINFQPKSINVIVGSNNTGKSSIIEAIALNLSFQNKFKDFFGINIYEYLIFQSEYDQHFLVRENKKFAESTLTIKGREIKTTIGYFKSGYPNDFRRELIEIHIHNKIEQFFISSDSINRRIRESYIKFFQEIKQLSEDKEKKYANLDLFFDKNLIAATPSTFSATSRRKRKKNPDKNGFADEFIVNFEKDIDKPNFIQNSFEKYVTYMKEKLESAFFQSEKMIFCLYEKNELKTIFIIPYRMSIESDERIYFDKLLFDSEEIIQINVTQDQSEPIPFITYFSSLAMQDIEKLHDIIVKKNKIHEAVDSLKKIKYIKDIRKTEDGIQVFISGHENPIPLSSMGSGFISLLILTFDGLLLDDGIILLEEPEISLHPGYVDLLIEGIYENSRKTQFFITTHSQDIISALLNVGERIGKLEDLNFLLLHKIDDTAESFVEIINGVSAKDEIDKIHTDLRGP
jgi:AAA15 family ATPase/GTPase